MTATQHPRDSLGTSVLALGAGTLLSALAAGAFLVTYQGVGLIGYRTAGSAALSVLLLGSTVTAFALARRRGPTRGRASLGLALAIFAYPSVFLLSIALYAALGALGIEW